jgi:hypothetical protein
MSELQQRYIEAYNAWKNAIQTAATNPGLKDAVIATQGQVETAITNWRAYVLEQRRLVESNNDLDKLSRLAGTVAEEKDRLRQLKAKEGTSIEQATSVNPKIVPSPYVNILSLRRNFRYNTKVGLIVASSIFGLAALGTLGFLVYKITTSGPQPSPILQAGGASRKSQ